MKEKFNQKLSEAKAKGYNIGACVRVQLGDKFLLLRRSATDVGSGIYENCGGSVDEGETIEVAAVRELFEESGIVAGISDLQPLEIFEFHNIETGKHKVKFAFNLKLDKEPKVVLSNDHDNYIFLNIDEIEKMPRQNRDEKYMIWEDHYKVLSL